MMKNGGEIAMEWMWKVYMKAWRSGQAPDDRMETLIVPLYQGKESENECKNRRGMRLLSLVCQDSDGRISEGLVGEGQGGLRKGRGRVALDK